jgi:hypothetical protein
MAATAEIAIRRSRAVGGRTLTGGVVRGPLHFGHFSLLPRTLMPQA